MGTQPSLNMHFANLRMSKPVEKFHKSLFEPGSKISNAPENNSAVVSVIPLELERELKEDYIKVGERKVGVGIQQLTRSCALFRMVSCTLRDLKN